MEIGTTITILVLLLVCIIPFAIVSLNSKKKKNKLLTSLNGLAEQYDCKIAEHDFWSHSVIGMSNKWNFIFTIRNLREDSIVTKIQLNEMEKCRVVNSSRTVKNNGSDFVITDKILLAFTTKNKDKSDAFIEFYNSDHDSLSLTGELQLAEKWCNLINNKILSLI